MARYSIGKNFTKKFVINDSERAPTSLSCIDFSDGIKNRAYKILTSRLNSSDLSDNEVAIRRDLEELIESIEESNRRTLGIMTLFKEEYLEQDDESCVVFQEITDLLSKGDHNRQANHRQ